VTGARPSGEAAIVERTVPADLRRAAAEVLFGRPWSQGPEGDLTDAQVERLRDMYALELHELKEHSVRQIAKITRESKSTVERRLTRAKAVMLSETGLDLN
jgi:DNA invertase Pin-like site-specific DNA recombinase